MLQPGCPSLTRLAAEVPVQHFHQVNVRLRIRAGLQLQQRPGGAVQITHAEQRVHDQHRVLRIVHQPLGTLAASQQLPVTAQAGDGAHARAQLDRVERLLDEVIRPGLDAFEPRIPVVQGREHQHGDFREGGAGANPPTHLEPVQLRHHDIQQDQVGHQRARPAQAFCSRTGEGEPVLRVRQEVLQGFADAGVIIHHQDGGDGRLSGVHECDSSNS